MENPTSDSAARKRRAPEQEAPSTSHPASRKRKKYGVQMRVEAVDNRKPGACPPCKRKKKKCVHRVRKAALHVASSPRLHYTRGSVSASESQAGFLPIISTWEAHESHDVTTGEPSMYLSTGAAISAGYEIPVAHVEDLKTIFEPWYMDIDSEPTEQPLQTAGRAVKPFAHTEGRIRNNTDDSHVIGSPFCDPFDKSSPSQFSETYGHVTSEETHLEQLSSDDVIMDELRENIKKARRDYGLLFTEREFPQSRSTSQVPRPRSSSLNSDSSHTKTHSSQSISTVITTPFDDTYRSRDSIFDSPQPIKKQLPPIYLSALLNGPLASLLNDCLEIRNGLTHRKPAPHSSSPRHDIDIYRAESESHTQSVDAWQSKCASWIADAPVKKNESKSWEDWL